MIHTSPEPLVAEKLRADEDLTVADVDAVRHAKDELQVLAEDCLAPIADGTDSWDWGAGMMIPYGVLCRHLEEPGYPSTVPRTDDE